VLALSCGASLFAQVPRTIAFQGSLSGVADGDVTVTLTIYDALTGGTELWTQTKTVTVKKGLFATTLGEAVKPFPVTMVFDKPYFVGVKVGAETLSPRFALQSVPYALGMRGISVDSGENLHVGSSPAVSTGSLIVNGTDIKLLGRGGGAGNNNGAGRALVDMGAEGLYINLVNDFGKVTIQSPVFVTGKLLTNGLETLGPDFVLRGTGNGGPARALTDGGASGLLINKDKDFVKVDIQSPLHVNGNADIEGNIRASGGLGVLLGYTQTMITNASSPFTSGAKMGAGRWGLFVEPATLTAGIPAGEGNFAVATYNPDSSVGAYLMNVTSSGNVGLGNVAPPDKLSVSGGNIGLDWGQKIGCTHSDGFSYNSKWMGHYSMGWFTDSGLNNYQAAWLSGYGGIKLFTCGTPRLTIDIAGNVTMPGDVSCRTLTLTSSRRFKDNVQPIHDPLATIMKLQGVTYTWKPEQGGKPDMGFIAEDVAKVLPELVTMEKDGVNAKGMDYSHLVALAIEGIKAQQQQIQQQQQVIQRQAQQIAELKAKNQAVDSRLARIEARLSGIR
jgi:hypothetical protein